MNVLRILSFIFLFFSGVLAVNAQEVELDSIRKGPKIQFDEAMKDMGDIKYGEVLTYTFTFTNIGSESLVLANVVTTCSCSSRSFTEGAIAPGQKGTLEVRFDSAKQSSYGRQNKVFTVLSNAINNPDRVILNFTILP